LRFPHFYSQISLPAALIIIFVVLALIGIFNAYKMGKFRKKEHQKNPNPESKQDD